MTLKFGKQPPRIDSRTLQMMDYLPAILPTPQPSYNILTQVEAKLGINDPTVLFPLDGNGQFGDCTIAALMHADTVYHGLVGKKSIAAARTAINLYFRLTGGEDTGLVELDVLNYWRKHSVGKDKILAYVQIDPKKINNVKLAIDLFAGVYLGFTVPENCLAQFNAHQPWTGGKLTQDGHAVYAVAYDTSTITVLTWGTTQLATWGWWTETVDESYAILAPEAKIAGYIPGFDLAQLQADLKAITG